MAHKRKSIVAESSSSAMTNKNVMAKSSSRKHKVICVFGGSKLGNDSVYLRAARELGRALATRNIDVVYDGDVSSLGGHVAMTAILQGRHVLGVRLLNPFHARNPPFSLGHLIQVPSLPEQMWHMLRHADAFVALPGGLETLEAISNVALWSSLNFSKKPLGLLNINGFYDALLSFCDQSMDKGFITLEARRFIISSPNVDALLDELVHLTPALVPNIVEEVNPNHNDMDGGNEPDTELRL